MKMVNEKKSIIEEALLEAEKIDATFKSNAKEILAQTMSSEIEEMVKESLTGSKRRLKEEDEEEELNLNTEEGEEETEDMDLDLGEESEEGEEMDLDFDTEGEESEDMDLDLGDESEEMDLDMNLGDESEDMDVVDLSGPEVSDADRISVFKKMGPDDEIEVVNDNGLVTLKDNKSGSEYRIELGSGTASVFDIESEDISEGVIYEITLDEDYMDEDYMDEDYMDDLPYMNQPAREREQSPSQPSTLPGRERERERKPFQPSVPEWITPEEKPNVKAGKEDDMSYMSKKGLHYTEKYNDNPKLKGRQRTKLPDELQKGIVGADEDGMSYMSRTLGAGSKFGRNGLPKPRAYKDMSGIYGESKTPQITKLIKENTDLNTKITSIERENVELKETQEKMVDALKQFRKKLQEVAVFNSNLTYAVRLFTEQATTKDEKQEILKRLDEAKDIKESQSIYKQLVKEFSTAKTPIKETIEEKINKTASSGSAQISESSVFVHPELQNMKKLWEYNYKK